MKTAGKVIGYILLVALLLAGVGLIWRYTNGFNENSGRSMWSTAEKGY